MDSDFRPDLMSKDVVYCLLEQCPQAICCLRYLSYQHSEPFDTHFRTYSPIGIGLPIHGDRILVPHSWEIRPMTMGLLISPQEETDLCSRSSWKTTTKQTFDARDISFAPRTFEATPPLPLSAHQSTTRTLLSSPAQKETGEKWGEKLDLFVLFEVAQIHLYMGYN